jgi:hypothetical protein
MTEQLEFRERVYRSFPAPLMNLLLRKKGVGYPTAVVESIEGSTGIPGYEEEEFVALMKDMDAIAAKATRELKALAAQRAAEEGRNGNNGGRSSGK